MVSCGHHRTGKSQHRPYRRLTRAGRHHEQHHPLQPHARLSHPCGQPRHDIPLLCRCQMQQPARLPRPLPPEGLPLTQRAEGVPLPSRTLRHQHHRRRHHHRGGRCDERTLRRLCHYEGRRLRTFRRKCDTPPKCGIPRGEPLLYRHRLRTLCLQSGASRRLLCRHPTLSSG